MNIEQTITMEELRKRFAEAAGERVDMTGYEMVYAWHESLLGGGENYALAFHPQKTDLWALNLRTGLLREIPVKEIRAIREEPSCRYRFFYHRSLRWESFYVPYLSEATGIRLHCIQLEAGQRFHLFCKAWEWKPWTLCVMRRLTH